MSIQSEIKKGERDAKARQAAKRRAEKLGRSLSVRSAGRAAVSSMKSGGRGVAIHSQKSGRGFKGLAEYATDPKKQHELIYTNCSDEKDALKSMIRAAERRPDIHQPVGHITLSLPPSVGKEKRWAKIVEKTRIELGIDDSFPCMAVRHNDTDHDHIHFIFSRVSISGKVHDQANVGLRCASLERIIERDFNLKLFKSPAAAPAPLSKNEIEKALRKKQQPPRMQIAAALNEALKDQPTPQQLVERLELAGITVKANISQTAGKMSGLSFELDGIAFGASKIDKKYGWKSLQEQIDYDETRDNPFLAKLNAGTSATGQGLAAAVAAADRVIAAAQQLPASPDIKAPAARRDPRAALTTPASTSTTPAGAPVADATKDTLAKNRGSRLDPLKKPSQPTTNKEQSHGTTDNNNPAGDHPIPASRKNFGKFKRRSGARGVRTLSQIPVAPNLNLDHLLLRDDGRDNVADQRAKGERNSSVRLPVAAAPRIAKPNLSSAAWERSAALLKTYRDSVKEGVAPDALDREAVEAGYRPEEVINAHAVTRGIPHAEAALRVAESSPTPEVLKFVEAEYKQAAQRSASRLAHNLDPDAPKAPAPK